VTQVAVFKCKCATCRQPFTWPVLSDMSYGEALIHGAHGTIHAHAWLIDHPVFDLVSKIIPRSLDSAKIIWEIFARLADPVDGQSFTCRSVCPFCGSPERDSPLEPGEVDRMVGMIDVPEATFDHFQSLNSAGKLALVKRHASDINPR